MTASKRSDDDDKWSIKTVHTAGDLPHDTNSRDCWCCPDLVQPCRVCGVTLWDSEPVDEVADVPENLSLSVKFSSQADQDCKVCKGRGLEPKYDDDYPFVIFHH